MKEIDIKQIINRDREKSNLSISEKEELWLSIEPELPVKERRRRVMFWLFGLMALIALVRYTPLLTKNKTEITDEVSSMDLKEEHVHQESIQDVQMIRTTSRSLNNLTTEKAGSKIEATDQFSTLSNTEDRSFRSSARTTESHSFNARGHESEIVIDDINLTRRNKITTTKPNKEPVSQSLEKKQKITNLPRPAMNNLNTIFQITKLRISSLHFPHDVLTMPYTVEKIGVEQMDGTSKLSFQLDAGPHIYSRKFLGVPPGTNRSFF